LPRRILIIEDDRDIAHLVDLHLRDLDCETQVAHDGTTGLELALGQPFDLVILDIMLPGVDGLEICRRLRGLPTYLPILMLTARSTEVDRVVGLEMGADDYLTKPFSIKELLARVKALFRYREAVSRQGDQTATAPIEIGDIRIDLDRRSAHAGDRTLELTSREFDLLAHFARHPGRVFSRTQLLDQVWGYAHQGYEHTVNSHINRLRSKLEEDPSTPRYILTVWGVGYRFFDPREAD